MRTNSFLPTNLLVYLRISLWELSLLVGLNTLLSALPSNNTQASKDSSKPEPRTSGLCYCTQLRWHPTVHGDSNRISRGLKETNITCCVLSEDFPTDIIFIRCHCPLSSSLSVCPPALLSGNNTRSQTNLTTSNNPITSTMHLCQCLRERKLVASDL